MNAIAMKFSTIFLAAVALRAMDGIVPWTGSAVLGQEGPAASVSPAPFQGPAELVLDPPRIQAGMFYDGATVRVRAVVPSNSEVAIVCLGDRSEVSFSRKGKVFGLIWMNVDEVTFDDIPTTYLVSTSAPLDALGASDLLTDLGVGYGGLERDQNLDGEGPGGEDLFGELVRLKESEGLYGLSEGSITSAGPSGSGEAFEAEFRLPAKAPEGSYRVLLFAFTSEEGALVAEEELRVEQVGVASFISSLGREHGLLYGILAVVIAIGVGLFTGFAFGLGSKGGH